MDEQRPKHSDQDHASWHRPSVAGSRGARNEHETNTTGDAPTEDAPTDQVKWPLWNVKGVSRRCREYCDRLISVAILLPAAGGCANSISAGSILSMSISPSVGADFIRSDVSSSGRVDDYQIKRSNLSLA